MYTRILVATDGSTLSNKAVKHATALAAACGAEIVALKVTPRFPQSYFEGSIPLSAPEAARVEVQWAADAQAIVDGVVDSAVKAKVIPATTMTRFTLRDAAQMEAA